MDNKYTKLKDLVDRSFTVEEAYGYQWKQWDTQAKRFVVSDSYKPDFRKIYTIKTNKGALDLGSGQLSSLLEATYSKGKADIVGKTFAVKSNGKDGMDIRYFFNLSREEAPQPPRQTELKTQDTASVFEDELPDEDDKIDLSDIPF